MFNQLTQNIASTISNYSYGYSRQFKYWEEDRLAEWNKKDIRNLINNTVEFQNRENFNVTNK